MSNNYFYNNFHGSTFQSNFMPPTFVPPPPLPPSQLFMPAPSHAVPMESLDQDYIKTFETKVCKVPTKPASITSIFKFREKLQGMLIALSELKTQSKEMIEKSSTCSDNEWKELIQEVNCKKQEISDSLLQINSSSLDATKKLIAKRAAKRLRLKRLRKENKRAKEDRIKERKEKSRKIDENLQKFKDVITKAKQAEESKLQADIVLRETLRKKYNAKKFISKLDALKKLRSARANTARGRGEHVALNELRDFEEKIDKLKLLWAQKLIVYEKEEEDLRATLEKDEGSKNAEVNELEKQTAFNLKKWRKVLFGHRDSAPQVNFNGDVARFIQVRHQWDQYVSDSGSTLPVGWVTPG